MNMFAMSKDKSEPDEELSIDEELRIFDILCCELLRDCRRKYGQEAEYQLRDQLDEARKSYVEQCVSDDLR